MDIENISEADLMSALDDMDISSSLTPKGTAPQKETPTPTSSMEVSKDSVDSIAVLLKELLNNKTLEITIKIKD